MTKVPVLPWRWKDHLASLRDLLVLLGKLRPRRKAFLVLAESIERVLRRSHEDRMKVFLSQFEFFPKALLFWNTPRLQCKGWRWAPLSFLSKNLDIDAPLKGGRRGYPTSEGLLVECPAINLQSSSFVHGSDTTIIEPTEYDSLSIEWTISREELQNDPDPLDYEVRLQRLAAVVWRCVRLHRTVTWPTKNSAELEEKIPREASDRFVILLGDDWMTGKKGTLASVCETQGQYFCVNDITNLIAVEQEPNQHTIRASGKWVPKRKWCVG